MLELQKENLQLRFMIANMKSQILQLNDALLKYEFEALAKEKELMDKQSLDQPADNGIDYTTK